MFVINPSKYKYTVSSNHDIYVSITAFHTQYRNLHNAVVQQGQGGVRE